MSRAGLNRKSALATLTMVFAAEAADLDVLWASTGRSPRFSIIAASPIVLRRAVCGCGDTGLHLVAVSVARADGQTANLAFQAARSLGLSLLAGADRGV